MRVIAISASYGAGGSVVAPRVAAVLGVPYLDRAVAASDSERIGREVREVREVREASVSEEELDRGIWQRVMNALAATPTEFDPTAPGVEHPDRRVRTEAEARLRAFAAQPSGGVVLGWAAPIVLQGAYCVRLDGPADQRLRQGMAIEDLDAESARERLERTDDARRYYWRRLYKLDWRDPDLYQLTIDSTAVGLETVVRLVVDAARDHWERQPPR